MLLPAGYRVGDVKFWSLGLNYLQFKKKKYGEKKTFEATEEKWTLEPALTTELEAVMLI